MNFAEYHQLILDTARNYDATDPIATDGSRIPVYSSLGLSGESGEVTELIKKCLRTLSAPDKANICGELGDVLWYIGRMAQVLGFTIDDVASINSLKLRHRLQYGKDQATESEIAKAWLENKERDAK